MVAEILPPSPTPTPPQVATTTNTNNEVAVTSVVVEADTTVVEQPTLQHPVVSVPSSPEPQQRVPPLSRSPLTATTTSPFPIYSTSMAATSTITTNHRGIQIDTDDEDVSAGVETEGVKPSVEENSNTIPTTNNATATRTTTSVSTSPIVVGPPQPPVGRTADGGSDTTSTGVVGEHRGRPTAARVPLQPSPMTTTTTTGGVIPSSPVTAMRHYNHNTNITTTTTTTTTTSTPFAHHLPSLTTPSQQPHAASMGHLTSPTTAAAAAATPTSLSSYTSNPINHRCINPASDINARLDTQVEVRVYPCNTSAGQKKKFTSFTIKPEGVIIQGSTRGNTNQRHNNNGLDLGTEYATQIGRKLCRYELADTRACQLLVTTHGKNFWVVPAPEAFSRHSGTCRLLGDRKHPPAPHTMQVGDFLRVGSVGVVVIETHDGVTNCVLSEEKIQRIMKDTTATGGFLDLAETDGENSDDSMDGQEATQRSTGDVSNVATSDHPVCYMCFDEEDTAENPMITPCKCSGDTKFVHVECLRKWHTAEADNQICFLSSVDATCSVCKSTFKSDFKLSDGRQVKLFKSSLEPPYVSLLVATKHEMAQRLFNTRFQLSFSTLMKSDGKNATRPLLLGRSSGSDMVLDYRTVSARHAAIRFKNGEFIFTDAGSSNGSYLYLRRPLELSPSQAVQFRLGRSMISMKVVNKWNRRLLRAVRGQRSTSAAIEDEVNAPLDDRSIGSVDGDIRITADHNVEAVQRRTRDSVMTSLPPPGLLSQSSAKHLDFLFALAYPKREIKNKMDRTASSHSAAASPTNTVAAVATPTAVSNGTSTTDSPPPHDSAFIPQQQAAL